MFRAILVVLGIALSSQAQAGTIEGVARVIDGDTIDIGLHRIRLFGIDAPEKRQSCQSDNGDWPCGQMATAELSRNLLGRTVVCTEHGRDRYKRMIATCQVGIEDIGAWMVGQGWALAYQHYSTAYLPQEEHARAAGIGIWKGTFTNPWDWRKARRSP
ncbi:MAG: thermonuclease family protein [Alphaproteobacteria bacterium]|nr:thermonuclease family protein [Alphaproteobacteria bacterium]